MSEINETLLSVKDLVVEYSADKQIVHAVNGVSLEIKKGKTLGLVERLAQERQPLLRQ